MIHAGVGDSTSKTKKSYVTNNTALTRLGNFFVYILRSEMEKT